MSGSAAYDAVQSAIDGSMVVETRQGDARVIAVAVVQSGLGGSGKGMSARGTRRACRVQWLMQCRMQKAWEAGERCSMQALAKDE